MKAAEVWDRLDADRLDYLIKHKDLLSLFPEEEVRRAGFNIRILIDNLIHPTGESKG